VLCQFCEKIDDEFFDAVGPQLKVVANYAVGFENINVAEATKRGVWATNTPDAVTPSTADIAWALMLGVSRRLYEADQEVRNGTFANRSGYDPCHLLGGDFDDSGMVTAADIDQLQAMYGANSPPVDPKFDLVEDGVIDGSDLDHLLVKLLRTKAGDTDLNRKVDISDFNTLASNFDPGGANAGTNGWGAGNFDADTDIDITDFNTLATNFDPGGSDAAAALAGQSADPGAVDLIVDLATGEVLLDANSAAISGIQVYSAAAGLLPGDPAPNALQFVIATNATTYAEGAFANLALDGLTSLGLLYDLLADTRDLSFEYTALGQPTVTGQVAYVPEPGSLALLVLTGVALAGYRSVGARRGAVPH